MAQQNSMHTHQEGQKVELFKAVGTKATATKGNGYSSVRISKYVMAVGLNLSLNTTMHTNNTCTSHSQQTQQRRGAPGIFLYKN
jgi:hypothetical protein